MRVHQSQSKICTRLARISLCDGLVDDDRTADECRDTLRSNGHCAPKNEEYEACSEDHQIDPCYRQGPADM